MRNIPSFVCKKKKHQVIPRKLCFVFFFPRGRVFFFSVRGLFVGVREMYRVMVCEGFLGKGFFQGGVYFIMR